MQQAHDQWFRPEAVREEFDHETAQRAGRMAERCTAHFGGVLRNLIERAAFALDLEPDALRLPIGPRQIAGNFLMTMRALRFDEQSIEIVQELFGRFVLDRLGQVYGDCNTRMQDAGFLTQAELESLNRARA
jgi:hypothetical protein